jgi:phytol kinase
MFDMALIFTLVVIFILLVASEFWWRKHAVHGEFSRKFTHITVGSFVAFWPFFLSWNEIRFLSLSFFVVVAISKYLHIFKAIHSVQRPTWGELYFALAVGAVSVVTHNKWIYMASLLQMSLADGLAAVMGVRYGKQSYLVFGHTKSLVGSLTFFIVSLAILVSFIELSGVQPGLLFVIGTAAAAAIVENLAARGLDNLIVPLLVAILLANH